MNDVRLPIETTREGDKITKVCVEDIYKIINRTYEALDKAYNKCSEVLESVNKKYWSTTEDNTYYEGSLIIGTGVSQPCLNDAFDEEIGNNIAFMKAKLNANIKKHNILCQCYNEVIKLSNAILKDLDKADYLIQMDLDALRYYNENYLNGIEDKLGI